MIERYESMWFDFQFGRFRYGQSLWSICISKYLGPVSLGYLSEPVVFQYWADKGSSIIWVNISVLFFWLWVLNRPNTRSQWDKFACLLISWPLETFSQGVETWKFCSVTVLAWVGIFFHSGCFLSNFWNNNILGMINLMTTTQSKLWSNVSSH